MRDEYNIDELGKGRMGKDKVYLRSQPKNVVTIKPELMKIFPTEKAINEALEKLAEKMKKAS